MKKKTLPMKFEEIVTIVDDSALYPSSVSDDVKVVLYNWFRFRRVSSDEYFPVWYYRKIDLVYRQFMQQLRAEPGISEYDWIIESYREYQSYTMGTGEESINTNGQNASGGSLSEHHTTESSREDSSSSTTSTGYIGKTTSEGDTRTLEKTTPQSLSYDDAHRGEFPDLGWKYPSGQGESVTESSTNDINDTETKFSSGSDSSDTADTSISRSDTASGTHSESSKSVANSKSLNRQLYSGRNSGAAELLDKAIEFIQSTNSMRWLISQMESCFLSIYVEEDYE